MDNKKPAPLMALREVVKPTE